MSTAEEQLHLEVPEVTEQRAVRNCRHHLMPRSDVLKNPLFELLRNIISQTVRVKPNLL